MDEFGNDGLADIREHESIDDFSIEDIPDMPDDVELNEEQMVEASFSKIDCSEEFPDIQDENIDNYSELVTDPTYEMGLKQLETYEPQEFPDMPEGADIAPEIEQEETNDTSIEQTSIGEASTEEVVPPDSAYEAFNNYAKYNPAHAAMMDYMKSHNYEIADYYKYSKDPEWQSLVQDLENEDGEVPWS